MGAPDRQLLGLPGKGGVTCSCLYALGDDEGHLTRGCCGTLEYHSMLPLKHVLCAVVGDAPTSCSRPVVGAPDWQPLGLQAVQLHVHSIPHIAFTSTSSYTSASHGVPVVGAPDRQLLGLQAMQFHVHSIPHIALHRAVQEVVQGLAQVGRGTVLPGCHLQKQLDMFMTAQAGVPDLQHNYVGAQRAMLFFGQRQVHDKPECPMPMDVVSFKFGLPWLT